MGTSATSSLPAKPNAVSILPKQTLQPGPVRAVTLAPRPSDGCSFILDVAPQVTAESKHIPTQAENSSGLQQQGVKHGDKKKHLRTRVFTEEDDNILISFWRDNVDLYTQSSKLAFSRKAADSLNAKFASSALDKTPTHEKQVHNKVCYLLKRYEAVLQKHGIADTSGAGAGTARVVEGSGLANAKAEFPYFPRMNAFLRPIYASFPRKRRKGQSGELVTINPVTGNGHIAGARCASTGRNPAARAEVKNDFSGNVPVAGAHGATSSLPLKRWGSGNPDSNIPLPQIPKSDIVARNRYGVDQEEIEIRREELAVKRLEAEVREKALRLQELEYELKKKEVSLHTEAAQRLESELELKRKDLESRLHESVFRMQMERINQLRESAKTSYDMGLTEEGKKYMSKVEELLSQ